MSKLIENAIPTDLSAIIEIKKRGLSPKDGISSIMAKEFYPTHISNNKNFICSTSGCKAPITCKSIKPENVYSPCFVNQVLNENKHIKGCPYDPLDNLREITPKDEFSRRFNNIKSGYTVSDFSITRGFSKVDNQNDSVRQNNSLTTTKNENKTSSSNNMSTAIVRETDQHIKTLSDHVEVFKSNPDFKIKTNFSRGTIPIKYMFKPLYRNIVLDKLHDAKYPNIYYGNAKISETKEDTIVRIEFKNLIILNKNKYRPSLIISREYFEDEFPDILSLFEEDSDTIFEAFITLPFFINGEFLNFSSFTDNKVITSTIDELFQNFYIRYKKKRLGVA